jgi:predicted esterase
VAEFAQHARLGWLSGRLSSRPGPVDRMEPYPPGLNRLDDDPAGAALLVPERPPDPAPLIVLLHGATSNPLQVLPVLGAAALEHGAVVLAPKSVFHTWDVIGSALGPDVEALDVALHTVFHRIAIDPSRVMIAGFSDGASYALTLGLANGDLFGSILALSPGFVAPVDRHGRPRIFVSHGRQDRVLPIDRTSRRIVPGLRSKGYSVDYREFVGGHEPDERTIQTALSFFSATATGVPPTPGRG